MHVLIIPKALSLWLVCGKVDLCEHFQQGKNYAEENALIRREDSQKT